MALLQQGIWGEVIDTNAACRPYSMLLSEDRNVVAVLMID
jgi:uncharacterized protein